MKSKVILTVAILFVAVVLVVMPGCQKTPDSAGPCTAEAKQAYFVAMLHFRQASHTAVAKRGVSQSERVKQLAPLRDQAAEEPAPGCQGAQAYRSAILDYLEAQLGVFSGPPLFVSGFDDPQLQKREERFIELQRRLAEAQDAFLDAPMASD